VAARSEDAGIRQLLNDLAQEERSHRERAESLGRDRLNPEAREHEDETARRLFVLQVVQPGWPGLMDGSVSDASPSVRAAVGDAQPEGCVSVGWRHRLARVSAWDSRKRCQTMGA